MENVQIHLDMKIFQCTVILPDGFSTAKGTQNTILHPVVKVRIKAAH